MNQFQNLTNDNTMTEKKLVAINDRTIEYEVTGLSDLNIVQQKAELEEAYGQEFELIETDLKSDDVLFFACVQKAPNTLNSGVTKVTFNADTLEDSKFLTLRHGTNKTCVVMVKYADSFSSEDVAVMEGIDIYKHTKQKSQTQRIREALYKLFMQENKAMYYADKKEKSQAFDNYYRNYMEGVFNGVTEQITETA